MSDTAQTLGKYRITRELGRGGFGVVYLAEDTTLGSRPVALKVLHPQLVVDPDSARLFGREAGVAARLDHPHIVTVYEAGEIEGQRVIAMRYMPGVSLDELAGRTAGYSGADIVNICRKASNIPFLEVIRVGIERDIEPRDFEQVMATVRPSVEPKELHRYERFSFGD